MALGRPRHGASLLIAAITAFAAAAELDVFARSSGNGAEPATDALLHRVVSYTTQPGVHYRALREMHAGTLSGKHKGWMRVETGLDVSDDFWWRVIEEGGSERTRDKVFRELLKNEALAWREGKVDESALSPANYEFLVGPRTGWGERTIRLVPRREDSRLIDGTLVVSADGFPLRVEGRLAKSPSFWVKSVTVVRTYGRIAGLALPVSVESIADVRFVGPSAFSMRYSYREVNGRNIPQSMAWAPFVGPSAEILALHGSASGQ